MLTDLAPHQRRAVDRLSNGKVLWGGVGTGKTRTACAYYDEKEAPKDVYVITTAKKRDSLDWDRQFAAYGVGKYPGGTTKGLLTVDSWNNVGKYAGVQDAFFIFDEQRIVGAGTWSSKFLQIAKKNNWILLSGTPGDTWMDYIPLFIANGWYKNRTEFKRKHVIYNSYAKFPKVDRYVEVGTLVRHRHELLVEMPYIRHTSRRSIEIPVLYDGELMDKVARERWHVYEDRPLRDIAEQFSVMRKVANSDPSRLSALIELISKHPKMIVFYNFDYELQILRSLSSKLLCQEMTSTKDGLPRNFSEPSKTIFDQNSSTSDPLKSNENLTSTTTKLSTTGSTDLEVREWNGHKHEDLPTGDRWVYLVQYVAGAEGWDCISTNVEVMYSLPYSYKIWEQAHGRIERLNTPYSELIYYSLVSNSPIDRAAKRALDEKRSFQPVSILSAL